MEIKPLLEYCCCSYAVAVWLLLLLLNVAMPGSVLKASSGTIQSWLLLLLLLLPLEDFSASSSSSCTGRRCWCRSRCLQQPPLWTTIASTGLSWWQSGTDCFVCVFRFCGSVTGWRLLEIVVVVVVVVVVPSFSFGGGLIATAWCRRRLMRHSGWTSPWRLH